MTEQEIKKKFDEVQEIVYIDRFLYSARNIETIL